MIYEITGTLRAIDNQTFVVQPQGTGLSFALFVPQKEPVTLGAEIKLLTYMHWNQEQGPTLYGFFTNLERKVFLLLISCSGIGPKIGLCALEAMSPEALLMAIHEENIAAISSISGIGKKKAEQLIVFLKHKVQELLGTITLDDGSAIKQWQQVSEVLASLNYSRQEITQAVQHMKGQPDLGQATFDTLLRKTLSFLSKLH
jgi:holliday junction DNA helicase RuvA